LPLNANGKVDRKALPEPERQLQHVYVAPSTATEERLARIWREVLKVGGDVSVTADSSRLVLGFGPFLVADLAHWHFDTFKATWRDPEAGTDLVTFALDADGKVDHLTWPGQGDFARVAADTTK